MINKKKLWFVTLFSLILVLSIYYVTMPEELLTASKNVDDDTVKVEVNNDEADILVALRIEADKKLEDDINDLKMVLSNVDVSIEDKNKALDSIKELNNNRAVEEKMEEKIKSSYDLKSFVKIDKDQARVVIASDKHDNVLANNIMRLIRDELKKDIVVSVKFQTS